MEDPAGLEAAIWTHDSVYEPGAEDNELRSAQFADHVLDYMGVGADARRRVHNLVMVTADHDPSTQDEQLLADLDLSVLGARPTLYDAYSKAIREEFAHLSDEDFRTGRAQFLSSLLDKDAIYHTPEFRAQYERTAKQNLRRELESLERA